ncbi:MAG: hypothetical protein F6J97_22165, partial [Leptolyngbya sp. SIO4C1]|nr:hypothetical protein [Leptolyngbya sp. SIO4C1]
MKAAQLLLLLVTVGVTAALNLQRLTLLKQEFEFDATLSQTPENKNVRYEHERQEKQLVVASNAPTFGYQNLIADWVFLQFLQYFGDDELRRSTGYDMSPNFFKAILKNDPYYLDFYIYLSGSTTLYAGLPEETVSLIDQAAEQLSPNQPPNAFYVWRYKGTDELLFLGDSESAV